MHKREDGFVVVNEEGMHWLPLLPYGLPVRAPQHNADKGHMTKCDGCHERVARGKSRFASSPARCGRWISADCRTAR